jgi:hypothetical protein
VAYFNLLCHNSLLQHMLVPKYFTLHESSTKIIIHIYYTFHMEQTLLKTLGILLSLINDTNSHSH